ncbi:MAG: Proline iminopeptidase [Candidatus Izimaplasma bacterium HR2]|nr:MAG: Proline iminopeptidase [Candidatus Izimaplasma bacterium HR2]
MRKSFYVDVSKTRLYVETIGEGYPLFIVHGGIGFNMKIFGDYLDILAKNFKLIYFDQRGQGKSDKIAMDEITLENVAEDIVELANKLDLKQYAVLGHSLGGFVALTLAVNKPEAASHIILLNTVPNLVGRNEYIKKCNNEVKDPEMIKNLEKASALRFKSFELYQVDLEKANDLFHESYKYTFKREFIHLNDSERKKWLKVWDEFKLDTNVTFRCWGKLAAEYDLDDLERRLKQIKVPVLIISGENDFNCDPKRSIDMNELIPNSKLYILEKAGHYSYVEKPKEIAKYIKDIIIN